ncbi:hypothetical protein C8R45DRAFT_1183909 [Mycena sanguinolenta]|nr:hypothetical protein C8R45DRAFT_1183909 [Mycena sanguinolenta]
MPLLLIRQLRLRLPVAVNAIDAHGQHAGPRLDRPGATAYDLAIPPLRPPLATSSLHTMSTLEPKSTRRTTPRLKRPLSARTLLNRPRYRSAALRVGGAVGIPWGRAPEERDRGHHWRKETETRIHKATQLDRKPQSISIGGRPRSAGLSSNSSSHQVLPLYSIRAVLVARLARLRLGVSCRPSSLSLLPADPTGVGCCVHLLALSLVGFALPLA